MSFGPGFQNTRISDFFDPVAITWAFIAGGIFEGVRFGTHRVARLRQRQRGIAFKINMERLTPLLQDRGIDGYIIDEKTGRITIFECKYHRQGN